MKYKSLREILGIEIGWDLTMQIILCVLSYSINYNPKAYTKISTFYRKKCPDFLLHQNSSIFTRKFHDFTSDYERWLYPPCARYSLHGHGYLIIENDDSYPMSSVLLVLLEYWILLEPMVSVLDAPFLLASVCHKARSTLRFMRTRLIRSSHHSMMRGSQKILSRSACLRRALDCQVWFIGLLALNSGDVC